MSTVNARVPKLIQRPQGTKIPGLRIRALHFMMATPTDGLPIPWFIMYFHGLSSCSPETQWPVSSMFELCHHAFLGISQRYSGGNKALNLLPLLATHRLK